MTRDKHGAGADVPGSRRRRPGLQIWATVSRIALYSLPVITVIVVAFALFVVGAPEPYAGVRIYGGPTEGATRLSWRLSLVRWQDGVQSTAHRQRLAVEAKLADGRRVSWAGHPDSEGMAAVDVEVPGAPVHGPVSLEVTSPGDRRPLANGRLELGVRDWLSKQSGHGGWIKGKETGDLLVRAAPARGVFAVPFSDPLWIEVRGPKGPVPDAKLSFKPEGLDLSGAASLETRDDGRAVVRLAPREFNVALRIAATAPDGTHGEWYSTLPVVAGAMHARLHDSRLRVRSPIQRDRAYFALMTPTGRIAGRPLDLAADSRGGAIADVALPPLPPGPLWAVVSSEPDLSSGSTVGWPLGVKLAGGDPPHDRVVPDRLLLDGLIDAARRDAVRRKKARLLAGLFSAFAAALVGVLLVLRVKKAEADLAEHLAKHSESSEEAAEIPARGTAWVLLIAVLCLTLGFLVLALVAMYRIG